jgi:hypothetical protein
MRGQNGGHREILRQAGPLTTTGGRAGHQRDAEAGRRRSRSPESPRSPGGDTDSTAVLGPLPLEPQSHERLISTTKYPPLRGTRFTLGEQAVWITRTCTVKDQDHPGDGVPGRVAAR